ncbi:MAG: tyrosine-type recombinase/integrase [Cyanobacteria bacterium HKST-UBA03]|nr:tyrosine-type recombinase/integrase [Cyanobacteria bacterium HKST-UBA03]
MSEVKTDLRHFLKVSQAAIVAGVSERTIIRWCESGKLPAVPKPFGPNRVTWLISPLAMQAHQADIAHQKAKKKLARPHGQHVEQWLDALTKGGFNGKPYSQRTVDDYQRYAAVYFDRHKALTFKGLQDELMRVKNHQFSKRHHYYHAMLALAKYMVQQEALSPSVVDELQTLKPKRSQPPKKTAITDADYIKLVEACQTPTDRAMVTLLGTSGIRASEFCALRVADLDLEEGWFVVRCGKGGKARRLGMPDDTIGAIRQHLIEAKGRGWLFTNANSQQMTPYGLRSRLLRLGKVAGVTVTTHALRRHFVTSRANKGYPLQMIQAACGHSRIQTTMGYVLNSETDVIEAMKEWE